MSLRTPISIGTGVIAGAIVTLAFLQTTQSLADHSQQHEAAPAQRCGNGTYDAGNEQCDDGGNVSGDGCSASCQVEGFARCGNNFPDPGEECDDGNRVNGDGCTQLCRIEEGYCGDGNVQAALGEQCDDGNEVSADGCSFICLTEAASTCGDGKFQADTEQCDTGSQNADSPSACRRNCLLPRCGDGIADLHEQCDDGNGLGGDGCSPVCIREQTSDDNGA